MFRLFINFLVILVNLLNFIFEYILKINFKGFFTDQLRQNYKTIKLKKNAIKFFIPSHVIAWRVNTFFEKEPKTLNWIDNFKKKKK